MTDTGFTDVSVAPAGPVDEARPAAHSLREVRHLLLPIDARLPKQLERLFFKADDLAELGKAIYDADVNGSKIVFIGISNEAALVALRYPEMFRLKPAVVTGLPNTEYHPRFNQAVFGVPSVTWGYIVDALGLDDRLRFDATATVEHTNLEVSAEDRLPGSEEEPDAS